MRKNKRSGVLFLFGCIVAIVLLTSVALLLIQLYQKERSDEIKSVQADQSVIEESGKSDHGVLLEDSVEPDKTQLGENIVTESGTNPDVIMAETSPQQESEESVSLDSGAAASWNRAPVKVKGIYVTGPKAGSEGMKDLITLVDKTELNTMVIDIKNDGGEITYKMDLPMAEEIGATKRYVKDMPALIQQLKEKDIYLIARIVAFKDPILAEEKPEWAIKNKDGSVFRSKGGLAWINPYRQEVWEYIYEVSKKAVGLGFDEIQFDYIRFPTDKGIQNAVFGPQAKGKSKTSVILDFTKEMTEKLSQQGVFVSADVFGTIIDSPTDEKIVGQDYREMAQYLDYICPMIYPSHYANGSFGVAYPDMQPYDIILAALTDSQKVLAGDDQKLTAKAIVRPWLQDFTASWLEHHIKYDAKAVQAQIKAVEDAGYEEWILWNGSNRYTEEAFVD